MCLSILNIKKIWLKYCSNDFQQWTWAFSAPTSQLACLAQNRKGTESRPNDVVDCLKNDALMDPHQDMILKRLSCRWRPTGLSAEHLLKCLLCMCIFKDLPFQKFSCSRLGQRQIGGLYLRCFWFSRRNPIQSFVRLVQTWAEAGSRRGAEDLRRGVQDHFHRWLHWFSWPCFLAT